MYAFTPLSVLPSSPSTSSLTHPLLPLLLLPPPLLLLHLSLLLLQVPLPFDLEALVADANAKFDAGSGFNLISLLQKP
jgi:hypothetical protein